MRVPRKRFLFGGAAAAVLLLGVAAAAPGGVDRYDGDAAGAPSWTKACWKEEPRQDRRLLSRCARVSGRVLWVRKQGFGASSKAEMVLSSGFGLVLSKMTPYDGRHVPAIGHYVHIVGPLVKSKTGLREVQFFAQE
jgi:hypothetical protein